MDAKKLAALMGISERSIRTMRSQGMPHQHWGIRRVVFRPSEAMQWARERGAAESQDR